MCFVEEVFGKGMFGYVCGFLNMEIGEVLVVIYVLCVEG